MLAALICNLPSASGGKARRRFVKYDGTVTHDEQEFWLSLPPDTEVEQEPFYVKAKPKRRRIIKSRTKLAKSISVPSLVEEDEEIEELLAILVAIS